MGQLSRFTTSGEIVFPGSNIAQYIHFIHKGSRWRQIGECNGRSRGAGREGLDQTRRAWRRSGRGFPVGGAFALNFFILKNTSDTRFVTAASLVLEKRRSAPTSSLQSSHSLEHHFPRNFHLRHSSSTRSLPLNHSPHQQLQKLVCTSNYSTTVPQLPTLHLLEENCLIID